MTIYWHCHGCILDLTCVINFQSWKLLTSASPLLCLIYIKMTKIGIGLGQPFRRSQHLWKSNLHPYESPTLPLGYIYAIWVTCSNTHTKKNAILTTNTHNRKNKVSQQTVLSVPYCTNISTDNSCFMVELANVAHNIHNHHGMCLFWCIVPVLLLQGYRIQDKHVFSCP